jgi:hypothetical protein
MRSTGRFVVLMMVSSIVVATIDAAHATPTSCTGKIKRLWREAATGDLYLSITPTSGTPCSCTKEDLPGTKRFRMLSATSTLRETFATGLAASTTGTTVDTFYEPDGECSLINLAIHN